MKKLSRIAMLFVAATLATFGGRYAPAADKETPQPLTWEYQAAMETGSLPSSDFEGSRTDAERPSVAPEMSPTIEVGGIVYRIGVDTP